MPDVSDANLIWIDLEMTGLDTDRDEIIEIATVITDNRLNILAEGPTIAIHQSDHALNGMDDWNTTHHTRSGLVDRIRRSEYDYKRAERETLAFLQQWVPAGKSPMCGNSICQDRRFLHRLMPELERYFHYRHVDVSTLKELANRWVPDMAREFKKQSSHLAMEDIRDSIRELRFFRERFLKVPDEMIPGN